MRTHPTQTNTISVSNIFVITPLYTFSNTLTNGGLS